MDRFTEGKHPAVAATVAVPVREDPVPVSDQSVLVARVNRTARAALAMARPAALVPVRRAVAVARATTSGMELAGCQSRSPIRALRPMDRLKRSAYVRAINQQAPDLMCDRPFTQDASKLCNK